MKQPEAEESPPRPVTFREALAYWLKLGFVSFGGPAGQIAMMHQELVERRRWLSEHRFLHALNYCMVLPGPEAQQLATYIGWLMHGTWGGIAAGTLFVLPSLLIIGTLSWIYLAFGDLPLVAGVLYGIKPAVVAIVLFAAWLIGQRTLRNATLWGVAIAAFIAIFALRLPFPAIVLGAGAFGWLGGRKAPAKFVSARAHADQGESYGQALIDDHSPTPPHALFRWGRAIRIGLVGLGLWSTVMGLLATRFGWEGGGRGRSRRWAGSLPRRHSLPLAGPTQYSPMSIRGRWNTTGGSMPGR